MADMQWFEIPKSNKTLVEEVEEAKTAQRLAGCTGAGAYSTYPYVYT